MAITYTQTDTAIHCSAVGADGETELVEGGTPGTTEQTVTVSGEAGGYVVQNEIDITSESSPNGSYTARLNVTTANMSMSWTHVQWHLNNNSCSTQGIDTDDHTDIGLGSTGVKSVTVSATAVPALSNGDRLKINYRIANSHMQPQSLGFTPDQDIDTPLISGPTGPNIAVPSKSFNLDPKTPSVQTGVNVASPIGSFNLAPQTPAVGTSVLVLSPAGSFALSGFAPSIAIGVNIITPFGTFNLNGFEPLVATGVNIISPLGTFTLTGFVPTITTVSNINIDVPLHTFTLGTFVPTIQTGVNILVPVGTFTLNGFVPNIGTGVIIAVPVKNYSLNFNVPLISIGVNVVVPLGAFNLNSFIPNVGTGVIVTVPIGSFSLTGLVPTIDLTTQVTIRPPLHQFSLSSFAPQIHAAGPPLIVPANIDLTPPFDDISQIRFLFRNFAIIRDLLDEGVTGQFTTNDGKTVLVRHGIITDIY